MGSRFSRAWGLEGPLDSLQVAVRTLATLLRHVETCHAKCNLVGSPLFLMFCFGSVISRQVCQLLPAVKREASSGLYTSSLCVNLLETRTHTLKSLYPKPEPRIATHEDRRRRPSLLGRLVRPVPRACLG